MLFNSVQFLIFFLVVLIFVHMLRKKAYQHIFLLLASYYFYWVSSREYVLLMLVSSIGNFYLGRAIHENPTIKAKKWLLALAVIFNLSMLGFFKYTNFVISIINDLSSLTGHVTSFRTLSIFLPVGISFYTFQAMSYTLDIYFGKIKPISSLSRFSLFISFFPQLVAGPIVKAREFLPQLEKKVILTADNLRIGISIVLWGLVKKLAIADNIGLFVDKIFANPTVFSSSLPFIVGIFLFSIQVYCDFAGYSDIAIGVARILGFKLPDNFKRPYFSRNIAEFWRRWHMTLGNWVKDYIYTPMYISIKEKKWLRGINSLTIRTQISINVSIWLSLLIIGLWHGASWSFVLFGIYNGTLIVLFYQWEQLKRSFGLKLKPGKFKNIPSIIITYIVFVFSLFMFRIADLTSLKYVIRTVLSVSTNNLSSDINQLNIIASQNHSAIIVSIVFALSYIYFYLSDSEPMKKAQTSSMTYWTLYMLCLLTFLLIFFPGKSGAFIYFQF